MQGAPPPLIVLTPQQLYEICLRAARAAVNEVWVTDAEVAQRLGCSLRVWRLRYGSDPGLAAKSINHGHGQRAQRRWRLADVLLYLGVET